MAKLQEREIVLYHQIHWQIFRQWFSCKTRMRISWWEASVTNQGNLANCTTVTTQLRYEGYPFLTGISNLACSIDSNVLFLNNCIIACSYHLDTLIKKKSSPMFQGDSILCPELCCSAMSFVWKPHKLLCACNNSESFEDSVTCEINCNSIFTKEFFLMQLKR